MKVKLERQEQFQLIISSDIYFFLERNLPKKKIPDYLPVSVSMPATTKSVCPRNVKLATIAIVAIFGLGVGLFLGWLMGSTMTSISHSQKILLETSERVITDKFVKNCNIVEKILQLVEPQKIQEYLRVVVAQPHIAGTEGDEKLATFIRDEWRSQGMDEVLLSPYNVLLSYADPNKPNTVDLVDRNGDVMYRSTLPSLPLYANWTGFSYPYPYFAYSPNGTVVGDPVFVNYGLEEDYAYLETAGVDVSGKIAIARYGFSPCGQKSFLAEKHGIIGLLIYVDPESISAEGFERESVYPNTWWLPKDAIIRASAANNIGDPLTPGFPSLDEINRIPLNEAGLPKIPSQPINVQDATEILGRLGGKVAPEEWLGNLNITYRIGPNFASNFKSLKIKLSVYNQLRRQPSYNVIGMMYGQDEPDRYVIVGNHRDAWVKGSVDPGSGTAVLTELARTFGKLRKTGWKPRRTLVFCSWGAEEFGLIGSTEWVEEHVLKLEPRTVSYINVDVCVAGDTFSPVMSATLKNATFKIAKLVPNPDNSTESLYDSWWRNMNQQGRIDPDGRIIISNMGPFSDFASFLYYAGIPVMDLSWTNANARGPSPYPAYHTAFETLHYVEKFLDPKYQRHASCAQFTGIMMHYLSDSALLPFEFHDWIKATFGLLEFIIDSEEYLKSKNISLDNLKRSMRKVRDAEQLWDKHFAEADKTNPYTLRSLNDHMMLIQKSLFRRLPIDVPTNFFYRYGCDASFSVIMDLLQSDSNEGTSNRWSVIKMRLNDLIIMMEQLTAMLGRPYHTL